MQLPKPLQTAIVCVYMVPFAALVILEAVRPREPQLSLVISAVGLLPALFYLFGVTWCRRIVGATALISLLVWSLFPLALHAVDRTRGFWNIWWTVACIFFVSFLASITPLSQAKKSAEP